MDQTGATVDLGAIQVRPFLVVCLVAVQSPRLGDVPDPLGSSRCRHGHAAPTAFGRTGAHLSARRSASVTALVGGSEMAKTKKHEKRRPEEAPARAADEAEPGPGAGPRAGAGAVLEDRRDRAWMPLAQG